jgi:PAS domain S-box-containing protein
MIEYRLKENLDSSHLMASLEFGHWEFEEKSGIFYLDPMAIQHFGIARSFSYSISSQLIKRIGPQQSLDFVHHWKSITFGTSVFRLELVSSNESKKYLNFRGTREKDSIKGVVWDGTHENQKIDLALEDSGFGVWEFNPINGRLSWDSKMYTIYGHTNESFLGNPVEWTSCIHPEDSSLVAEKFNNLLSGISVGMFEFRIIRYSDQKVCTIEANGVSQKDSAGKVILIFGMNRDISLKKLEIEKANKQSEILAQATKMAELGSMAAGIAHEINNPLAIIIGKADLLLKRRRENSLSEDFLDSELDRILKVSKRIADIVKGLKNYSRNSTNDENVCIPFITLVEETLSICQDRFKLAEIDSYVHFGADKSVLVSCRPSEISQVILNLLNNAHDAVLGCEKKEILLSVSANESSIKLSVRDSGAGISPEKQDRIFEPFYSTKPLGKGTGLGLSISKNIAQSHGGKLYLEEAKSGAKFCLELPIATKSIESNVSAMGMSHDILDKKDSEFLSGLKFLLVDDESDILHIYREELESVGATVFCLNNAKSAISMLMSEKFDFLITDFSMPQINGIQLIEEINSKLSMPPKIFLCTAFNICSEERAEQLKIRKVLSKPFAMDELFSEIQKALD